MVYDLSQDPWEETDLLAAQMEGGERLPQEIPTMVLRLRYELEKHQEVLTETHTPHEMDAADNEMLEALGYIE